MVSQEIFIDAGIQDTARPTERPPKTNWKTELIRKTMQVIQYPFPGITARVLWHFFTKPGRSRFNPKQRELIDRAMITTSSYDGHKVYHYQWGNSPKKILLSHGWNSKIADFRKMINRLLEDGYQVEGIDMKAHGRSEGEHTTLPEIRDILKSHYLQKGPYDAIIGYSIGGLAGGLVTAELDTDLKPANLFLMASPPYAYFIFEDTANSLGFRKAVVRSMTSRIKKKYGQPIEYFDLRDKQEHLKDVAIHLIYDEDDKTIEMDKGRELQLAFPNAKFVRSRGLGHYKIIAYHEINDYICESLAQKEIVEVSA